MKLGTKILISYSVVLALVVLVCGWGVLNLQRLGKASEAILQENYRSISAAENMIDALAKQDSATLNVMLGNEKVGLQQFRENEILFLLWLGRAKDNITIPGEKQVLLTLEKRYRDYLDAFSQLQQQQQSQRPLASDYYDKALFPSFERVRAACTQLRELNQQTMLRASQRAQAISRQAIWSMIAAGGAAAGLGLTLSLLLSRRLVQPLREMTKAATRIAEGNYDIVITANSSDELGHLAQEIADMSQRLKVFHHLNVGKAIAEKQRSEAIIRSITDGVVVVDAQLKIIAINPTAARIFNTTPQQAPGSHCLDIVRNQELYDHLKTTAQTGTSPKLEENESILSTEYENRTQYYNFVITPVTTEEGCMLGVVLLLRDVTKLKELDRMKSDFIATASHELRTPLTGMAMSINLLLETAQQKLSSREQELLKAAQEDVERLRTLVNDLLDLSKIESGRSVMDFTTIEVSLLVDKAISMFAMQVQEKQVELAKQLPPESLQVKADPNKIIWVLTNLIANALRYTDAGGRIEVSIQPGGDWAYLSVSDNGAGIPLEYQSKIFDKFVQVKTDRDIGGSGLGLAICKEIVKAHGGTIWVESTPGQGSTFKFMLPVVSK